MLERTKKGPEPKFRESGTFGGFGKRAQSLSRIFNTGPYGDPPLKIKISKIGLRHVLSWPKLGLEPKFHESGTFGGFGKRGQSLSRIFNTGPYGDPPLKIKILKIGLRHVLSWPKLGLEPKFHESGTFGGFGKRAQSFIQYPADF